MIFKKDEKFEKKFIVSENIYMGFIEIFNDKNPMHVSDDFAINKGFKRKVMHGNILNGFISYFVGECLPTKEVIIHSQEIQYKKPIYLGDELFFEAIVNDVYHSVNAVEFKFNFKKNDHQTVSKGKIQIGILV